jgi:hypothetical protein
LSSCCSMGLGNMLPCMSLQLGDQPVMVLCTFALLPEGTWSQIVFRVGMHYRSTPSTPHKGPLASRPDLVKKLWFDFGDERCRPSF